MPREILAQYDIEYERDDQSERIISYTFVGDQSGSSGSEEGESEMAEDE